MSVCKSLDLSGEWFISHDPENIGKDSGWEKEIQPGASEAYVPSIIQQFFPDYHGVAYYWCRFTPQIDANDTDRIMLCFGGADYKAEVWLNGVYLGAEEGGETPFSFDATDAVALKKENLLAVRIVNPTDKFIDGLTLQNTPHRNKEVHKRAGCNLNHGGLWYGVTLNVLPAVYIEDKLLEGNIHDGSLKVTFELNSTLLADGEALLSVEVLENTELSGVVAKEQIGVRVPCGKSKQVCCVSVPEVKLWSVDDPNLYKVRISVETPYGEHTLVQKFGFREFCIKGGYFYLNGKKMFLRSSHSGNAFPIGQMFPARPEQIRKDFIYAKSAGFNMIRCISGLYRPEQMDIADEIGLLIYDECFASWCMSYSAVDSWRSDEEFEAMLARHPAIPVGDEKAMLARWVHATEQMIKRDRNRTCVVVWGMLNETYPSSVFKTAHAFLPRLRELDPTRAVLLNSGRWDNDISIGSASNPYSGEWEYTWGDDGVTEKQLERFKTDAVGDTHYYPVSPISDADAKVFRTLGSDTKYPKFLSEFGVGSQFHVIEEYKHFMQHGERLDLEDSWWLGYQSEVLTKDFYRLGLDKLFPFPESMLKESQRMNADERKRHFDMLRSNPRLAGYSLTGLLDHGMCGEGLWSYWRRWKPEMFDAISEGWAPLRFCLFVKENLYRGDSFEVECVLANDGVLKSGNYTADFAITGEGGIYARFSENFALDGDSFAPPVMKRTLDVDLPEGKYKLEAQLREGSPTATATHFYVTDRNKHKAKIKICALGLNEEQKEKISALAELCDNSDVILVGTVEKEIVATLMEKAQKGATVLFLNPELFWDGQNMEGMRKLAPGLTLTNHRDWLYHKEYVLYDRELFDTLGGPLMELTRFKGVFPHLAFMTDAQPDYIGCPGFWTGYYRVHLGYGLVYSLFGFNCGEGRVVLNCFDILGNLGRPVADRMLGNLLFELS